MRDDGCVGCVGVLVVVPAIFYGSSVIAIAILDAILAWAGVPTWPAVPVGFAAGVATLCAFAQWAYPDG